MAVLKVERIGGLAGFGSPKSRLRSVGEIDEDQLSDSDKRIVDNLFTLQGDTAHASNPDQFRYRISRITAEGTENIEADEDAVPNTLKLFLKDEIR